MKKMLLILGMVWLPLASHAAELSADAGLADVRALGRLNGLALSCSMTDVASRIKQVMIQHAPKSSVHGQAFEQATNEAYLARSRGEADCPDKIHAISQVEDGARALQALGGQP
ncbi:MAG: hypothetical protein Q8O37_17020 [Sulfuricellaceae bacterium]|nr:hypothetical protein [Sulfuricellaceae bacterium]